jgi:hypothetical protein
MFFSASTATELPLKSNRHAFQFVGEVKVDEPRGGMDHYSGASA